ncbi:RHS repeat-associated core domain-containing protein [Sorangium sp. So ce134]
MQPECPTISIASRRQEGRMARTAPVPNIPAIPGMNPGTFILGGGGAGGGGGGKSGRGNAAGQRGRGRNGGRGARGGGKGGRGCGQGSGAGCGNPVHGGGGRTTAGDPVDVSDGRVFTIPELDLVLPGPLPLFLERFYSTSALERDVGLGYGWTHSLAWEIEVRRRTLVVHLPDGTSVTTDLPELGGEADLGEGVVLRRDDTGFVVVDEDGLVHLFSPLHPAGSRWLLSAVVDLSGNRIELRYREGRLEAVQDSAGRVVQVRRRSDGHIARFEVHSRGAVQSSCSYEVDERGDLRAVIDGDGNTCRFEYDEHHLTTLAYPSGLRVQYRYDKQGRCIETWCERSGRDDPALDASVPAVLADGSSPARGFLHVKLDYGDGYTEVINSLQVRRYIIGEHGSIDLETTGRAVATSTYNAEGQRTAYADPLGATTRWEHDAAGRTTRITAPDGTITMYAYNERGNLAEIVDALGGVVRYEYDDFSRLRRTNDDLGTVLELDYDARGQCVRAIMPDGATTTFRYDDQGNLIELVEPHGRPRQISFDPFGRVTHFVDENGTRSDFFYDGRGQLLAVRLSNGGVQEISYDEDGLPTRIRGADGGVYELSWGGYSVVHELKRPTGEVLRFRYDREGNLVRIINDRGEEHVIRRDAAGRVVGERTFDGRELRYQLDLAGNIVLIRDASGDVTELVRDSCGRITERVLTDGVSERFEYDALGRLLHAENGEVACDFVYDARGRLTRETQRYAGRTYAVGSEYTSTGYRTVMSTSLGHVERITPNLMGLPNLVLLGGDTPVTFVWDALDNEIARGLPGGGAIHTRYDPEGCLAERHVTAGAPARHPAEPRWVGRLPPGTTFAAAYEHSAGGDLLSEHRADLGRRAFAYDAMGRALGSEHPDGRSERFHYGAGGALHDTTPREYGAGGRLVKRGDTEYIYDAEGRLIEKRTGVGGATTWRYEWNAKGLLAAVVAPDGTRVENVYDCFARRIVKRVIPPADAARTVRFVWDDEVTVHEIEEGAAGDGAVVCYRTYAYREGEFSPLAHRDTRVENGALAHGEWVHYVNGPGEIPALLVSGRGDILADLRPSVWGRIEPDTAARAGTACRYPGQYADVETGLSYERYRFYDPEIGRFISTDPIGLAGGLEPFTYAHNQPFRFFDPMGLVPVTTTVTGSAAPPGGFSRQSGAGTGPNPIHPVVQQAMPPRAPDNDGVYPAYDGRRPPGRSPSTCGEPRALSRYIYAWEAQNRRDPRTGRVRPLNPNDPNDHADIQRCLGSIRSIRSTQPRSNGHSGRRAPCPNCSQLFANLHHRYGQPNPRVIQPGRTSRDGRTRNTNFSPPHPEWVAAQQQAIAQGQGRSGPQPLDPRMTPAPATGPAFPPHRGYGRHADGTRC